MYFKFVPMWPETSERHQQIKRITFGYDSIYQQTYEFLKTFLEFCLRKVFYSLWQRDVQMTLWFLLQGGPGPAGNSGAAGRRGATGPKVCVHSENNQ